VVNRAGFPAEIRYALDCARRHTAPHAVHRELQYIDLLLD
jgi:hypothetical protein